MLTVNFNVALPVVFWVKYLPLFELSTKTEDVVEKYEFRMLAVQNYNVRES